jgi:hypothetical protein
LLERLTRRSDGPTVVMRRAPEPMQLVIPGSYSARRRAPSAAAPGRHVTLDHDGHWLARCFPGPTDSEQDREIYSPTGLPPGLASLGPQTLAPSAVPSPAPHEVPSAPPAPQYEAARRRPSRPRAAATVMNSYRHLILGNQCH